MQTSARVRASGVNPRRRDLMRGAWALLASTVLPAGAIARRDPKAVIDSLEEQLSGRIGVAALDTGRGTRFEHRQHERFALCSTFKLLLARVGGPWGLTRYLRSIGDPTTRLDRTELEQLNAVHTRIAALMVALLTELQRGKACHSSSSAPDSGALAPPA